MHGIPVMSSVKFSEIGFVWDLIKVMSHKIPLVFFRISRVEMRWFVISRRFSSIENFESCESTP